MRTRLDIRAPAIVFEERARPDQKTATGAEGAPNVVIFGSPRGGTTMIAGIGKLCGLEIGSDLPKNLEDQAFVNTSIDEMILTVRERNRVNRSPWGWKYPRAAAYLPEIQSELRNPHYVVVWRDVLANATRAIRNGQSISAALRHYNRIQEANIRALEVLDGRFLLVSYEKAVADPIAFAQQLSKFIGLSVTPDGQKILEFSKPGSYKVLG